MNIFVGNLPYSTTEDDLREIFKEYGTVQSSKVIMDRETGKSKGFGFVEMSDDSAKKAINELDEADLNGKTITVNEARPKKENFNRNGGGFQRNGNRNGGFNGGGNSRRSW